MASLGCGPTVEGLRDETGHKVVTARHVRYAEVTDPGGGTKHIPVVAELRHLHCLPAPPPFPHLRQIGYTVVATQVTPLGTPVFAEPWMCCDAFCTDEEEATDNCYVEESCWPYGPGPSGGIAKRLRAFIGYRHPCSFNGVSTSALLEYDPGDGKWKGRIPITNGVLCLAFSCDPMIDPDDPGKFVLEYQRTDCEDDPPGVEVAGYTCRDPLRVDFPPFGLPLCCPGDCLPPEDAPNVTVTVVGNCRRTGWARHISYTLSGGRWLPVVAETRECDWHQTLPGCCEGTIPGSLTLNIVRSTQCCFDGISSVPLAACDPTTGYWSGGGVCGPFNTPYEFRLKCGIGLDPLSGWLLKVICGAQESEWTEADPGGACVPFSQSFDLTNSGIAAGCCGVEGILQVTVTG